MEIEVFLNSQDNECKAQGLYIDEKRFCVRKGSKVRQSFASHIRGGKMALRYRNDLSVVDSKGIVLQDCFFTSPSTAAQFVMGISTNGYNRWKVDPRKTLGQYLGRKI